VGSFFVCVYFVVAADHAQSEAVLSPSSSFSALFAAGVCVCMCVLLHSPFLCSRCLYLFFCICLLLSATLHHFNELNHMRMAVQRTDAHFIVSPLIIRCPVHLSFSLVCVCSTILPPRFHRSPSSSVPNTLPSALIRHHERGTPDSVDD
jgi:hypothetical protein